MSLDGECPMGHPYNFDTIGKISLKPAKEGAAEVLLYYCQMCSIVFKFQLAQ
jgi:hypothetical protein